MTLAFAENFMRHFIPIQASAYAARVDHFALILLLITLFFSGAIALTIVFLIIKYRARSGPRKPPPGKRATIALEAAWIAIPLAIVLGIFVVGANLYVDAVAAVDDAEQVLVVAKQWMWKLQHQNGTRELDELHIVVGRTVSLTMISQDVIHSFYVPELRLKMDVLPDRYTFLSFNVNRPGIYHLFCAEYCGTQHARMRGRVVAMSPDDYAHWLAAQAPTPTMAGTGAALFEKSGCPACHQAADHSRAPALDALFGSQVLLSNGDVVTADLDYIRESIVSPAAKVVAGYAPIMPAFGDILADEDVAAIVSYIHDLARTSQPRSSEVPSR